MESTKRPRSPGLEEEVRASYKRLCSLKRAEQDIEKKVKSIDARIDALYKKRESCAKKKALLKAGPVEKALIPYSRSLTLALVTKMRSRLPRELRDMVYEHLWKDAARNVYNPAWATIHSMMWRPACTERPCQCLRGRTLPTFIDAGFVGPDIALEAVEALYKQRTLNRAAPLTRVDAVTDIKPLVCSDAFHVGLDPATVLRAIDIVLPTEEYTRYDTDAPYLDQTSLRTGFEPLLRIVNKSRFELRITLSQRHIRLNVLEEFLDALRPILEVFEKEGANINLKFAYRHYDSMILPKERSLFGAFADPKSDWKKEMITWLDNEPFIIPSHKDYLEENDSDYDPDPYEDGTENEDDDMYDSEDDWDDYDRVGDLLGGCPCGCDRMMPMDEEEDEFW